MNEQELQEILTTFHEATNLNIYVFKDGSQTFQATTALAPNLSAAVISQLQASTESVRILLQKKHGIIAAFIWEGWTIVGWSVNYNIQSKGNYDNKAPLMGVEQFCALIKTLYALFYHKFPQEIRRQTELLALLDTAFQGDIHSDNTYQGYLAEQLLWDKVAQGDEDGFNQAYRDFMSTGIFGTFNAGELRDKKDLAIATTTLATRAAIRGGLAARTAYALSDRIIAETEKQTAITNIYEYNRTISLQFLRQVARSRRQHLLPLVNKAEQFMQENLATIRTVQEVAEYLGINQSYLMHLFKANTGLSVKQYLTQLKLEEAKRRLIFGKQNLAEIAVDLGYKEQSQFSRNFKKLYGITPLEFRRNSRM
ncbi:helix-turn-helix domain-containing protein [Lactobacillus porci]|uniref:helix-turn-helix domain-containing protein n=1 Tax=Lactobacillus porci TaxID=2012477 RepID=UPI0039951C05